MKGFEKSYGKKPYDFSMDAYRLNPGIKYDIINNRGILISEVSPSVAIGLAPDLSTDGTWYRDFIFNESGADYYQSIVDAASDPRIESAPLDIRAIVVMPVSGLGDSACIYATLEKYDTQDQLKNGKIPIVLWVNALESQMDDDRNRSLFQLTADEIERAKVDFPGLNIVDMYYMTPNSLVSGSLKHGGPWGLIMKRAYDIVAIMAHNLTQRPGALYSDIAIIRNDSDVIRIDDDYFKRWLESLDEHNDALGMQGSSRFGAIDSEEACFPGLSVIMNILPQFDIITGDRYRFQAANFALMASAYCQMGGMGRTFFTGIGSCDAMLGERLKAVTRIKHEVSGITVPDKDIIIPVDASLVTDWSRPLSAYINNHNPRRAWTTWSDSANGIQQRGDDLRDIIKSNREGLRESISRVTRYISQLMSEIDEDEALRILGSFFGTDNIDYSVDDGFRFTELGVLAYERYYDTGKPCKPGFMSGI